MPGYLSTLRSSLNKLLYVSAFKYFHSTHKLSNAFIKLIDKRTISNSDVTILEYQQNTYLCMNALRHRLWKYGTRSIRGCIYFFLFLVNTKDKVGDRI